MRQVILNLQSTCVIMHFASCSIINVVVQNVSTTKPEKKIVLPFKEHIAASVVDRQWRGLKSQSL